MGHRKSWTSLTLADLIRCCQSIQSIRTCARLNARSTIASVADLCCEVLGKNQCS